MLQLLLTSATQSPTCQSPGSGISKHHKRNFRMGWLDACGKDLSRKDFPSNCLLSSAHLKQRILLFLGVLVSKGLVQFVHIPFPKARNQVFFFSALGQGVVMLPKKPVSDWWRIEKGRTLEAKQKPWNPQAM